MADMWDGTAAGWEQQAQFVDTHTATATAALLDAAGVGPGSEVIDLACGPGGAGIMAAGRVGPSGRVVLADVAPAMVEVAARRSAGLAQVSTMVCDQLAIEAPDESFDAVISRHGLMFVDQPSLAVREGLRVLKPGGRYAAVTWATQGANPWLGLVLDAVGAELGGPFPPPGLPGPFSLDRPDVLAAALRAGGLVDVQVEQIDTPMAAPSVEAWWERVKQLAGPLALLLAALEAPVRDAIRDRALASGASAVRVTATGVEFGGSVLVGSGRRI